MMKPLRATTLSCLLAALPFGALACDGIALEKTTLYNAPFCFDQPPQRMIALDASFTLGIGMDVGLSIVGAPLTRMGDHDLKARAETADIADLGFVTEPSIERLIALQPDVIVGFVGDQGLAESLYPMLSQIAPTVLETDTDWRAYYRTLAKLGQSSADINADLAALDARIESIKPRIPKDLTVSVLRITSWDMQSFSARAGGYAPFALMSELGIRRSAYEEAATVNEVLRPDWEDLAQLDGDVMLYIVGGTNNSDTDGRHEEVLTHPLWAMLPAVQKDQVHRVDHGTWMEFNGLASAHKVLDDIEAYVVHAEP